MAVLCCVAQKAASMQHNVNQSIGKENFELSRFQIWGDLAARCYRDDKYFFSTKNVKTSKTSKF
jgi:hypothetical protein